MSDTGLMEDEGAGQARFSELVKNDKKICIEDAVKYALRRGSASESGCYCVAGVSYWV